MLPYSLELLADCLKTIQTPDEPFDPNGEWEHHYAIWNPARAKSAKSERAGSLRFRRRLTPDGSIRLQVTQSISMLGTNGSGVTEATLVCANDDLATPLRWKAESRVLDPQGKPVPHTSVSISGRADKGSVALYREKESRMKVSGGLTSNWSLPDALQRLPFDAKPIEFDMIEDLELLKPGQRLRPGESAEVQFGGRKMALHSFEHTGSGILPWTYWLDDSHRLIIAVGQRMAYLLGGKQTGNGGAK